MTATPPSMERVALVRERPCDGGRCQTLWLGEATDKAVEMLAAAGGEKVEEIAFSADGSLVGFLVNGYQLRVFEAESRLPRATVELFKPERHPLEPHRPRDHVFDQRRRRDLRRMPAPHVRLQVGLSAVS